MKLVFSIKVECDFKEGNDAISSELMHLNHKQDFSIYQPKIDIKRHAVTEQAFVIMQIRFKEIPEESKIDAYFEEVWKLNLIEGVSVARTELRKIWDNVDGSTLHHQEGAVH